MGVEDFSNKQPEASPERKIVLEILQLESPQMPESVKRELMSRLEKICARVFQELVDTKSVDEAEAADVDKNNMLGEIEAEIREKMGAMALEFIMAEAIPFLETYREPVEKEMKKRLENARREFTTKKVKVPGGATSKKKIEEMGEMLKPEFEAVKRALEEYEKITAEARKMTDEWLLDSIMNEVGKEITAVFTRFIKYFKENKQS